MVTRKLVRVSKSPVPTLVRALKDELRDAAAHSADQFIRLDVDVNWPWSSAVVACWPDGGAIGLLPPHEVDPLPSGWVSTTEPTLMTRWRNTPSCRPGPGVVVVVGPLRATEETAGLDKVPAFITTEDVLARWGADVSAWLPQLIPDTGNVQFVGPRIAQLLQEGTLDPHEVDEWVAALRDSSEDALRDELWLCRLFPDRHLLDQKQSNVERRIAQNVRVRRLLEGFVDGKRDEGDLRRLHKAARDGSTVAQRVLTYSAERDRSALRDVQLEDVLGLLQREKPDPDPDPDPSPLKSLDVLAFLNEAGRLAPVEAEATLDRLGVGLQEALDGADPGAKDVEASATVAFPDEDRDVAIGIEVRHGEWVDPESGDPILASAVHAPDSAEPDRRVGADALQSRVAAAGISSVTVESYLSARRALLDFGPLVEGGGLLEVLLTVAAVRSAAHAYLEAWSALMEEALSAPDGPATVALLEFIPSLECQVLLEGGGGSKRDAVLLAPFHPYVLEPVLGIAEYGRRELGAEALGDRVRWAMARAVPAFSVLWMGGEVFFLAGATEGGLRFTREPAMTRPSLGAADRITEILRAYIGFHEYAQSALAVEFLNPPSGNIASAVTALTSRDASVGARLVLVGPGAEPPRESELNVLAFQGRFRDPQDWVGSGPDPVHVRFAFVEANKGRQSAFPLGAGPTGGAHLSVQLRMQHGDPLAGDDARLILEYVPRGEDSVVGLLHRVANSRHGSAPYFAYPPALESDLALHADEVRESCDWLVIGAPHPVSRPEVRDVGPDWVFLGTETSDAYVYFVFGRSLYAERRRIAEYLRDAPESLDTAALEAKLNEVARSTTRGILSIGRGGRNQAWEHLGRVVAQATAMEMFGGGSA
jgi:hypothetical protein